MEDRLINIIHFLKQIIILIICLTFVYTGYVKLGTVYWESAIFDYIAAGIMLIVFYVHNINFKIKK